MDTAVRLDDPRGRWVLLATVLGSSTALLDSTVVNVALPVLGRGLSADFAGLQWTVSGYTLSLAGLVLLGGSLADRYGRRRVFLLGTVWFAVASALCAAAPSVETLVLARVLQGVGAALLTPASLALLQASFVPADRGRAIGAWSGLGGVAAAVGPVAGGLLVQVSWRLAFLLNLPLCVVVFLVARRHVPESCDPSTAGAVDVAGAALAALGLAGLTYGLIGLGGPTSPAVLGPVLASGALLLAAFVVVERRSRSPMLPLEIFAARQFAATNVVTLAVYAALAAVFLLLVVQLQVVGRYPPVAAGSALLPVTGLMLALSSASGALAARIGPRLQMSAGPLLCAVATVLLSRVGPHPSYVTGVLPGVLLFGLGLSATVAPLTVTVLAAAADRYAGVASGVSNAVARTAGLLAVAALPPLAGIGGADYTDPARFAPGFRTAMLLAAGLLVAGGVVAALTISDEEVRSRTTAAADPPLA